MISATRRSRLLRTACCDIRLDRQDFETFQSRQLRLSRLFWCAVLGTAVACSFAIGELWSFAVGLVVASVIALAGYGAHKRWNRARWTRRFPELRQGGFEWKQRSAGSRIYVGAGPDVRAELRARDVRTRVYVPYGPSWFRHWLGRLAESRAP